MSILPYNPNARSVPAGSVAYAPTAGWVEGWNLAYDAHVRGSSTHGLEVAMEVADEDQVQRWNDTVDGSRVPRLRDVADYQDLARYFAGGGGLDNEQRAALERYDASVQRAREAGRDVMTAEELFRGVQQAAQTAESDLENTPTTLAGDAAQLLGGMVASIDPRTDPFNTATLAVGSVGKSIATRVLSQVGAQGAIETINQITGVQENRRLLGLRHGFWQGAGTVATTALGAGGLQLIGEGAVAAGRHLGRRWFAGPNDAPAPGERVDPTLEQPPEPPATPSPARLDPEGHQAEIAEAARQSAVQAPYAHGLNAPQRVEVDLAAVTQQLDDWAGPRPWELDARVVGDTALGRVMSGSRTPEITMSTGDRYVDTVARQIDPNLFRQFDSLVDSKAEVKRSIDQIQDEAAEQAASELDDISDEIMRLRAKAQTENQSKAKKSNAKADKLEEERESKLAELLARDNPELRYAREFMMQIDYKMRDLAPLVTRAYNRARGRWEERAADLEATAEQIRQASRTRRNTEIEETLGDLELPAQAEAPSPVMQRIHNADPDTYSGLKGDSDAADIMDKILDAEGKALTENVDAFRAAMARLDVEGDSLTIAGMEGKINLNDTISVRMGEGRADDVFEDVTIRELLERGQRDEFEVEAMLTCSTRNRS